MPDLSTLEALARAAKPGPWERPDGWRGGRPEVDYIAAMSPDVCLKLLAVAKAAQVVLDDDDALSPVRHKCTDDLKDALAALEDK